jgi:hypothetical protein
MTARTDPGMRPLAGTSAEGLPDKPSNPVASADEAGGDQHGASANRHSDAGLFEQLIHNLMCALAAPHV